MKRSMKITNLSLLFFVLNLPVFGQTSLPKGFKDSLRKEFEKQDHCFHKDEFNTYYDHQVSRFQLQSYLKANPDKKYRPKGGMTPCGNGNFNGGISAAEWNGGYGYLLFNSQGLIDSGTLTGGITGGAINLGTSHQTYMTGGVDPNVGINILAPTGTTQSVRIGNQVNGQGFEFLEKTFTVTADNPQIRFWYAVVLQWPDNNHIQFQRPSFNVEVVDVITGVLDTNACDLGNGNNYIIGNSADPFLQNEGNIAYRDWSCATINLSAYIGRTVTIRFMTKDCTKGAHYGYAYISDICGSCAGSPMGSVELTSSSPCGPGRICVDLTVPRFEKLVGAANVQLHIYQNGILVQTLYSPSFLANTKYCFEITSSLLGTLDYTLGGFDFVIEGNFFLSGTWLPEQIIGIVPEGQESEFNNDYEISCERSCCPGPNYFPPNFFENPDNVFSSEYSYNPTIAPSSILPGQYTIGNSTEALNIASTWNTACALFIDHLLVNGRTGQTGKSVIFEYTIPVDTGTYKLCMRAKHLPQCAFDVQPIIDVIFEGVSGYDLTNIPVGTGFACLWDQISQTIVVPPGISSITLKIRLDETGIGDGNDLAIDQIQFIKLEQISTADVLVSISVSSVNDDGTFNIQGIPATDGWSEQGCNYSWTVMELDENYDTVVGTMVSNPAAWQTLPLATNFNGYNGSEILVGTDPGIFELDKRYRIVFALECNCKSSNKTSWIYDPDPERSSSPVFYQELNDIEKSSEYIIGSTDDENRIPDAKISENLNGFRIFPSPTQSSITMEIDPTFVEGRVWMLDLKGQMVWQPEAITSTHMEFNIQNFSSDIYIIRVENQGFVIQKYFIKE